MDAKRAAVLAGLAAFLAAGTGWAYKRVTPGRSELLMTPSKVELRVGKPVELKLDLYTSGRVTVRRDAPANFGVRFGSAEIGAPPSAFGSGLSLGVSSKEARVSQDEKISVTIKGKFRLDKRGMLSFVADGREPVAVGPAGAYEVQASFSPFTGDPDTMYRGESFSRRVVMTVGK